MTTPRVRPVDRCRWQPLALVGEHGMPVHEMPPNLFAGVILARNAILRAMRRDQPPTISLPR